MTTHSLYNANVVQSINESIACT